MVCQGVVLACNACGFFDATYTAKIFDDRSHLSLTGTTTTTPCPHRWKRSPPHLCCAVLVLAAAALLTASLSVLGGVTSAATAFFRTHRIEFVPRYDDHHGHRHTTGWGTGRPLRLTGCRSVGWLVVMQGGSPGRRVVGVGELGRALLERGPCGRAGRPHGQARGRAKVDPLAMSSSSSNTAANTTHTVNCSQPPAVSFIVTTTSIVFITSSHAHTRQPSIVMSMVITVIAPLEARTQSSQAGRPRVLLPHCVSVRGGLGWGGGVWAGQGGLGRPAVPPAS